MYANLRVTTPTGTSIAAHRVVIEHDRVIVHIDGNTDGGSKYPEPVGELVMRPTADEPITIEADF